MSVQFGRWTFAGPPPLQDYVSKAAAFLEPYGPDGGDAYFATGIHILYRAFHTTNESRREKQPHITKSGSVICWDGRLDNREDLLRTLAPQLPIDSPDVSIVAAAYEKWKTECFAKLIGDWALSIWNPVDRFLILAKDPIGVRHLYYSIDHNCVTWSTILDPLILLAGRSFAVSEEYVAGCFSFFPASHLTPYVGISSVAPSSFVLIKEGTQTRVKYWDFNPDKRTEYGTDAEYEEHFRQTFAESVRRRLRAEAPVLAELSGGLDSSSIVCMADLLAERQKVDGPRLDTVSYYNDSEPSWNERPYFERVEKKRGRTGRHISVGPSDFFLGNEGENTRFSPTPGSYRRSNPASRPFAQCLAANGNRAVLSGIGGDEFTGGVPTPLPELEDILAGAHFGILAHQLKAWALNKRTPWFHLLFGAARSFFPAGLVGVPKYKSPPGWLNERFVRRNRAPLNGYDCRLRVFGALPSFQENLSTLSAIRRQLGCVALSVESNFEKRYPYLDRDLLEFLFSVPRQQLVRPGQRRSLMRRSLDGIVPSELLNRKRKGFISRAPIIAVSNHWTRLTGAAEQMVSSSLGIIDSARFSVTLLNVRNGQENASPVFLRAFAIEAWLKQLLKKGIVATVA